MRGTVDEVRETTGVQALVGFQAMVRTLLFTLKGAGRPKEHLSTVTITDGIVSPQNLYV